MVSQERNKDKGLRLEFTEVIERIIHIFLILPECV